MWPSTSSVLMVHFPPETSTSHRSLGKWNSGRNISVGLSSAPALCACSRNVKMQFLRSNPWFRILPTVEIGDGRTYASAARNPGEFVSSGGLSVTSDEIEGVFNLDFKLPGLIVDPSEISFFVLDPASKVVVDAFIGVGGTAESGSGRSSREKIDKSSPFHWSPK